jgi:hypothetical protein
MNFDASHMSGSLAPTNDKFVCPDCHKKVLKGKEWTHKQLCQGNPENSGSSSKRKRVKHHRISIGDSNKKGNTAIASIAEELEVS